MPDFDPHRFSLELHLKTDFDGEKIVVGVLIYDGEEVSKAEVGLGIGNEDYEE